MKVEGLDEAIESINSEIGKIEGLAQDGFWEAGLKVMGAAQKRLKTSVVTGNLRASGYVRANRQGVVKPDTEKLDSAKSSEPPSDKLPPIGVEVGFTASYALHVHENMEGRSPKFLEHVIVENQQEIIDIVKARSSGE